VADPQTAQPVDVIVTKFMVQFLVGQNMGFARDVSTVPALLYPRSRGDYTGVTQAMLAFEGIPLLPAMTFMMDCASGASAARRARIDREAGETVLGGVLNLPFPAVCQAWGAPDLGPAYRAPVTVATPTLLVSGTLDGRTPVSNGEEVLQGLPNGTHLLLENGGHDTIDDWFTIPTYKDAVVAFLSGQPVPTTRITLPFSFVVPEVEQ
jgi:pimeloyl-ACP methyl ester carboxylesterase